MAKADHGNVEAAGVPFPLQSDFIVDVRGTAPSVLSCRYLSAWSRLKCMLGPPRNKMGSKRRSGRVGLDCGREAGPLPVRRPTQGVRWREMFGPGGSARSRIPVWDLVLRQGRPRRTLTETVPRGRPSLVEPGTRSGTDACWRRRTISAREGRLGLGSSASDPILTWPDKNGLLNIVGDGDCG